VPVPAPAAPAATDTPPATSAAPTPVPPETPAATPEPASAAASAPVPATSAAAAPSIAGARLRDPLLDDFERGESVSAVGPAWVGSGSEGAGSATTLIMGRVIKGFRDHGLLVSARMGGGREPFARAALKLDADDRPVDVSRFRGLRFDARGEGRYRVVFVTRAVGDGRYHESYFSGSPLWTPVNIPFASIGQNGPGPHVPWSGRDVIEVRFEMVRDAGRLGWLELDNVTFY
jgi:Carbohydrate binding domain (family 11)